MSNMPRPEYPRPDFARTEWLNLNGVWQHETDHGKSGRARGLSDPDHALSGKITVPFCRESALSGIGDVDFCECVWYRRTVTLPQGWLEAGRRTHLHIGACDYHTEVWVNGISVGTHIGGYVEFSFDITHALAEAGENVITICATDLLRSGNQPGGKQSRRYFSHGCSYTRTTGIWQTVWLENTPDAYLCAAKYYPSIADSKLSIELTAANADGLVARAEAFYEGRAVGAAAAVIEGKSCRIEMKLDELHLWEVGRGRLYELRLTLGEEGDAVQSYFGMRSIAIEDGIMLLNGKKVFQRLILDQGFYPDGIYTARDEDELIADIERSMALGFNGARLHQKVFEPRFLYHCDRLGYIVWGEHGNWGLDISRPESWQGFMPEWLEVVNRDFNHPAIIGWCPLNETQLDQNPEFVRFLAAMTRATDPTRLYIDASGWRHVDGVSDIIDLHCYEQDPDKFAAYLAPTAHGQAIEMRHNGPDYRNCPTFVSEYGGIRWASAEDKGWGYGRAPEDEAEFLDRYARLAKVILDNPRMGGLCYTQLTDVEQEVNGLYTYGRVLKFDAATLRAAMTAPAACEQE